MNNNLFTIGQTSKIKGITIKALRFYERIGLINPFYTDPVTRYRYYSFEQLIQLDVIRALRSIEVSPKDMVGILEKRDTGQLMEYLAEQKVSMLNKIALLQNSIQTIEQARNTIDHSISVIANREVATRLIPKRYILTQKVSNDIGEKDAMVLFSKFLMIIEENNLLDTYETGYYCIPDKKGEIRPSMVYNAVTANKRSNKALLSTIPTGEYLCVSFNLQNAHLQTNKLNEYMTQNKIQPRLILQVNLLNDVFTTNTQYCEIQVLL
ncbi:MerR family transcriptional regulator [Dehalogenimonas etheniformans]|uniref:MerR family DNA-binding transcriptional regulator n=1 Tax=Dehalogenimonas etheniformans TaxID=1536648 RepID=A0A2P5P712_9CHLR|nr:MerR family transcriptional regulator [Dehalogenimonas etheniformans]PPD58059.1 MerR family DNA-binding transcriptional regulator [Dehalogenimonas etheniformans]QNT75409.1 MerR family transcriptional regulator [Dehalogenimonas etheniformans]